MILNCDFCAEYSFKNRTQSSRIISEKDGHILIPTVGCFTEGYCLYVPKRHVTSFAHLGKSDLTNIQSRLAEIQSIIGQEYRSDVIVAEHGAGSATKCGASCIDHAHFHLIPVKNQLNVFQQFLEMGGAPEIFESLSDLSRLEGNPYVYLKWKADKHLVWRNVEKFPRQFVRIVCATLKGIGDMYNWRFFPFREEMQATTLRLRPRFGSEFSMPSTDLRNYSNA